MASMLLQCGDHGVSPFKRKITLPNQSAFQKFFISRCIKTKRKPLPSINRFLYNNSVNNKYEPVLKMGGTYLEKKFNLSYCRTIPEQ